MPEQEILLKLREIENLLRGKQTNLLTLKQAAQYLSISHSQLYKYSSRRKIPFHKPSGKYLYFFKDELDAWIRGPHPLPKGERIEGQEFENQIDLFDEKEEELEEEIEPP